MTSESLCLSGYPRVEQKLAQAGKFTKGYRLKTILNAHISPGLNDSFIPSIQPSVHLTSSYSAPPLCQAQRGSSATGAKDFHFLSLSYSSC